jgi:hypothetical protein
MATTLEELEQRVRYLEGEVAGENTVTRKILELCQNNARDIADVRNTVRSTEVEILKLRADLPDLIAKSVGIALRKG